MFRIIIVALLSLLTLSKQPSQKKIAVLKVENVELNATHTKTPYLLKNLDPARAVMITVEQSSLQQFSPFQLSISAENKSTLCSFKYANNLCVFEHSSNQVKAELSCLSNKCHFNIVFSQRTVISVDKDLQFKRKLAVPGEIFRIEKRKFNTILDVYAERDEHQVLSNQITVFSNIHAFPLHQVQQLDTNSAVFGLKPILKDTDQYVYIESRSKKSEHFTALFRSHSGQIRDNVSIVDFIENYGNHSHNNYTFIGSILHNLQINVRVFSPKDPKGIPLTLFVKGRKKEEEKEQIIKTLKFGPIDFEDNKFYDFTYAISRKVFASFKFISLQIQLQEVEDKSIFFELDMRNAESFQINIFDHIFFASDAGQELHFTVEPQVKYQLADGDKDIQLLTNAMEKYFSNVQSCSLHKGCSIQIKTENACETCSFKFNLKDEDVLNHVIYYEVKADSIEGKVDLEEEIYFKYAMNGKAITQVIVNSINVIIYAVFDNYERCKIPTASCHQFAINQQNPLVITNKDEQPAELILGIVGLEKTSFKVRFINQLNGLSVKIGEKFAYLMDDEEKEIELRLQVPKQFKEELYFNLISPIHSTRLIIANGNNKIESMDGFITIANQEIANDLLTIKIQKINRYYDEYLHFTLLVTTKNAYVRLDTTTTHYEKYAPKALKKYLFEYEPSEANGLNIYTENLERTKGTMLLQIRDSRPTEDGSIRTPILTRNISRDYEFIQLEDISECDDLNCQLEISIQSSAEVDLQQAITLLSEDSIISLDDSIWSVFEINEFTRRSHFYFIPRHQNKSITILFNTDDNHLYINYRIFNTKNNINAEDWPFDHTATEEAGHISNSQEINIAADDAELVKCWPNCAIIINIIQASQSIESPGLERPVIKSYKLLATNTIVQLLEDTRIEFTLKGEQERDFFIILNKDIDFNMLTFYTYYSIGRAKITATLFHNNKDYELKGTEFNDFETHIPKWILFGFKSGYGLGENNVFLRINIKAETNLKMNFQFTSSLKEVQTLPMDQYRGCSLQPGQKILYQFVPEKDFALKLYRHEGFPIFKIFKCVDGKYVDCFNANTKQFENQLTQFLAIQEKIKSNLEKEKIVSNKSPQTSPLEVFIQKNYEFIGEKCEQCAYFIWIYEFQGTLGLSLNLRSKLSQVELKEKQSYIEKVEPGNSNRYVINIAHNQRGIVGFKVFEGEAQVIISDSKLILSNTTINKTSEMKDFSIDITANSILEDSDNEQKIEKRSGDIRSASENHIFKKAHVIVSTIGEKPVEFMISYSLGESSLFLQDGIVAQKVTSGEKVTYFYRNKNQKEHAYLTLSAEILPTDRQDRQAPAHIISPKFYYYPDAGNRKVKEVFQPELPPKRNENYVGLTFSTVFELPAKYELYEIEITPHTFVKITASINHQELVYLPPGFEYLIKLHPSQSLNIVVDNPHEEYLEVKVKTCDLTYPRMYFTNDAAQFKRGIFEAEAPITNNQFKQFLETKAGSTMHLKFVAPSDADSLFTISVEGRSRKYVQTDIIKYKAGGNGFVSYKMIQSDTVEVLFKPVLCQTKQCPAISYFLVVAESIDQIYEELNCAGSYFIPEAQKLLQKTKTKVVEISEKNFDAKQKEFRYRIKLTESQQFIGVKGVVSTTKEEIQYIPIQIHNIWGELSKVSFGIILMVALALALVLTIVIVVSTKLARRGYKPISSEE